MGLERDADGWVAASTAEGAAAFRALGASERDPAVRCPDSLAAAFIPRGLRLTSLAHLPAPVRRRLPPVIERIAPGGYGYELARTRHIDGLRKRARIHAAFGPPPPGLRYVAADLNRDSLPSALEATGYDRARRTFVILAGVCPYLPEDSVGEVLDFVAGHAPGSAIAFDYLWADVFDGDTGAYGARELLARTAKMGEPLRSGIRRGGAGKYLAAHGLELVEELSPSDLENRYLRRGDGSLAARTYGCGALSLARVTAIDR